MRSSANDLVPQRCRPVHVSKGAGTAQLRWPDASPPLEVSDNLRRKLGSCGRSDFDVIAEVSDTVRKSGCGFVRIATREVLGTEIVVTSPIAQHVIDGCEDRGGDRDGRLFRPVTRFQAQELGLENSCFSCALRPRTVPAWA